MWERYQWHSLFLLGSCFLMCAISFIDWAQMTMTCNCIFLLCSDGWQMMMDQWSSIHISKGTQLHQVPLSTLEILLRRYGKVYWVVSYSWISLITKEKKLKLLTLKGKGKQQLWRLRTIRKEAFFPFWTAKQAWRKRSSPYFLGCSLPFDWERIGHNIFSTMLAFRLLFKRICFILYVF